MARAREFLAGIDDERPDGTAAEAGSAEAPAERRRVADRTNAHDAGSDANDTMDGPIEPEAVRHAAAGIPIGADPAGATDSVPIFDRGGLPPKV